MMGPLNPKQFHSRIWGVVLVLALLLTFLCSNLYSIQYTNGPEYAAQAVARVAEVEDVPASRGRGSRPRRDPGPLRPGTGV